MQKVEKIGKGLYGYKGAIIRKRNGMDMKRRPVSGFSLRFTEGQTKTFTTLKAALTWVDEQVAA